MKGLFTVLGMKQEAAFSSSKSKFFSSVIPVDTSNNTVEYVSYNVRKGDYLWALSERYGAPVNELAAVNNIPADAVLYVGQTLKIPVHNIAVKNVPGQEFGEVLDWFKEGQYVFPIGKTGKLIDLETGKSFNVKRTIGANHSDTEAIVAADTTAMKEIFNGIWSWSKKPFILEIEGRRFAVSVSGMPHAGVDGVPFLQNVGSRSDIDVAAAIGAEMYVIDAGWYGNEPNVWWDNVGDWHAGPWLDNGLEPIVEYAHNLGMKFGLWIEPEAAGANSNLLKEHPDWIMKRFVKLWPVEGHWIFPDRRLPVGLSRKSKG